MTRILLAEDNQGDVLLIRRALTRHGVEHELHLANDGEEASIFLERGAQSEECCFDLVLLDLNLPKVDGSQVLARLRKQSRCAKTPVIVLSSSNELSDRTNIAELGISHYFKKPNDLEEYMKLGGLVQEVLALR